MTVMLQEESQVEIPCSPEFAGCQAASLLQSSLHTYFAGLWQNEDDFGRRGAKSPFVLLL